VKEKIFQAKKSGNPDSFHFKGTEFQKLLKYDKKQSLNEYLKTPAENQRREAILRPDGKIHFQIQMECEFRIQMIHTTLAWTQPSLWSDVE